MRLVSACILRLLVGAGLSVAWDYDVPPPATDTPFLRLMDRAEVGVTPAIVRMSRHGHMDWVAGGSISVHGAEVHGTQTTTFEIATAEEGFLFLTNVDGASLRLASHVTLARCVVAGVNENPRGADKQVRCLQNASAYPVLHDSPCIYSQDEFQPGLFQHVIIDSVPTYGLALLLKRFLIPGAALVVPAANLERTFSSQAFREAPNVTAASKSDCGLRRDGSREWLFAGQGMKLGLASNDCFPAGTFDWYRRSQAAVAPGGALLYASREGGGGRGPVAADAEDLEAWLRALADRLGLAYVKTRHNENPAHVRAAFSRSRVVVAPHGGALTNLVYAHASTLVVEIAHVGPITRYCFACVAFASRFRAYAIFDAGEEYANYRDTSDHRLDVDGLRRFWETRLQPVYDDIAADVATQTTQGAAAPQDPRH